MAIFEESKVDAVLIGNGWHLIEPESFNIIPGEAVDDFWFSFKPCAPVDPMYPQVEGSVVIAPFTQFQGVRVVP